MVKECVGQLMAFISDLFSMVWSEQRVPNDSLDGACAIRDMHVMGELLFRKRIGNLWDRNDCACTIACSTPPCTWFGIA